MNRNQWKGRGRRTAIAGTLTLGSVVVFAACSSEPESSQVPPAAVPPLGTVQQADGTGVECDENLPSDSLVEYARKCKEATGVDVPQFNCDNGTPVPENHMTPGAVYPNGNCDAPNVLNKVCDPGSKFQVLVQTNDATVVAHCRKKGGGAFYGDVAVIQYNQRNGATCFYQSQVQGPEQSPPNSPTLPALVSAPSNSAGTFPWQAPRDTAATKCVRCHDNGPFVRSPYLAQLRNEPINRLPGTNDGAGRWDQRFSWNRTLPYNFVGNDFQSWKSFAISVSGQGSGCLDCHRLAISSVAGVFASSLGTARALGPFATDLSQPHKNPHSPNSPIWMKPGQVYWSSSVGDEANAVSTCAGKVIGYALDPSSPPPPGCGSVQLGQGNTCRGAPIRAVLNGATKSEPNPGRVDTIVPLGVGSSGDAAPGFCHWRTIHGPFWQTSTSAVPLADPKYRGSFNRIYNQDGLWFARSFSDASDGPANAPPGGTVECTRYDEIVKIANTATCLSKLRTLTDAFGSTATSTSSLGTLVAVPLTGLIGNIAQASNTDFSDVLGVFDPAGQANLYQRHWLTPPAPILTGYLKGEAWVNSCTGWTPEYPVRDVFTDSDIQLVAFPDTKNVRCFISGVTGAWSSTRSNATVQPFAEIYTGAANDLRLRVAPGTGSDRVGAYASCLRLQ